MEKSEIDILAEELKEFYFDALGENNGRVFAYRATYKVKGWEQIEQKAFRNAFFKFFKTNAQLRKTKDIKSDYFQLEGIKDKFNRYYFPSFCVDKKEYEARGVEYLKEVEEYFKKIITLAAIR